MSQFLFKVKSLVSALFNRLKCNTTVRPMICVPFSGKKSLSSIWKLLSWKVRSQKVDRSWKVFVAVFNNQIFFNFGSNFLNSFFPINLKVSNFSFKKILLFFTVKNFRVLEKSFIKKITTSPGIPMPIMTLILNPRQNQTMYVTLILDNFFNSNIREQNFELRFEWC